jgi:hypothetical protein
MFANHKPQPKPAASKVAALTFIDTVANRNFGQANAILVNNGIAAANGTDDLIRKLSILVLEQGDRALEQIAQIHPDRDLIMNNIPSAQVANSNFNGGGFSNCSGCSGGYSNCEGCGGTCGGKNKGYSNADGTTNPQVSLISKEQTLNTLAVIAVFGIIAIIISKQ